MVKSTSSSPSEFTKFDFYLPLVIHPPTLILTYSCVKGEEIMYFDEICFYGIEELAQKWRIHKMAVLRWMMSGKLQSHLWLPVRSVYKVEGHSNPSKELDHFEGFVSVTQGQCHRLFRTGLLTLREFDCSITKQRYQLPDTSEDIQAGMNDLVILEEERKLFEKECDAEEFSISDPSFRTLEVDGESYHFGEIQANVLQTLYKASSHSDGWMYGKQLLHEAGSESFSVSNVFKHKPIWKELIESDGRGRYRFKSR